MTGPQWDHATEGGLTIRLRVAGGRIAPAIESARPVQACRLLEGRPPQAAIDLLPQVFALCGTAQTHAGLTATERALGLDPAAPHQTARRLLLLAETAREHAWRLLLDWPRLIDEPPAAPALKPVLAAVGRLPGLLYPDGDWTVLGGGRLAPDRDGLADAIAALGDALATAIADAGCDDAGFDDAPAFNAWCRAGSTAPARVLRAAGRRGWAGLGAGGPARLPWLPEPELNRALAADRDGALARAPNWQGIVHETGPLGRLAGHPVVAGLTTDHGTGLLPRLAARLIELCGLPARMAALLPDIAPAGPAGFARAEGSGLAQIEMARGRLIHRIVLERGRVARYQVVAPTEWNFHPAGPLATALRGLALADPQTLSAQAGWLMTALDPCVPFLVIVDQHGGSKP
jgi:Ni,Fe-hydrogenase I large subunit